MRFIRLDENGIVVSVRKGSYLMDNEIASEKGELGQRMISPDLFEDVDNEKQIDEYNPTNAELAQMINELKISLMISGVI